jgi:predicted RNA-binding Zn ribbon-like protein
VNFTGYAGEAVDLAVDLVNTYNPVRDVDRMADPNALEALLQAHHRTAPGRITARDVAQVRELRARLRTIFEDGDRQSAAARINSLLEDSRALPRLSDHDGTDWHLHYTSPSAPLADELGAVTAMGLAALMSDGRWDRINVCEGDGCFDVFVDRSRNRSRRFCSAEVCGNRASVAAFRQRARSSS